MDIKTWFRNKEYLLLLVILFAITYRMVGLTKCGLVQDEIVCVQWAKQSLPELFHTIRSKDNHPPLLYLILHFWLLISGTELWIRLIPAILGLMSCWYIYKIGIELANKELGITAAVLAIISPRMIWQSQLTRMYIMCVFFSSASTLYYLRWLKGNYSIKNTVLYSLNIILGLYSFYFVGLLCIAHNLYVLIAKYWERSISLSKWFCIQIFILIMYSPWMWVLWQQILRLQSSTSPTSTSKPTNLSPFMMIKRALGTAISSDPFGQIRLLNNNLSNYQSTPVIDVLILISLIVTVILGTLYIKKNTTAPRIFSAVIPFLMLAPIFIIISLNPIVFVPYGYTYFSFVSIFSLILTAAAILYLRRYKTIRSIVITIIVVVSAYGYYWFHSKPYYPGHAGYREEADWIVSNPKVGIVNYILKSDYCFNYYWQVKEEYPDNYYYFPKLTSGEVTGIEVTSSDRNLFSNIIDSYQEIIILWGHPTDSIQKKNIKIFKEIIKRKNLKSTGFVDLYGMTVDTYSSSPPPPPRYSQF